MEENVSADNPIPHIILLLLRCFFHLITSLSMNLFPTSSDSRSKEVMLTAVYRVPVRPWSAKTLAFTYIFHFSLLLLCWRKRCQ
jgi:hypothetical protein